MSENRAALKIQCVWRGRTQRKKVQLPFIIDCKQSFIKEAFNNEQCDPDFTVTFKDGSPNIRVHKFILSLNSAYFKSLFSSGMLESSSNQVELDENYTYMHSLLRSLYSGDIKVKTEYIPEMFELADKYQFSHATNILGEYLVNNMDATQALHFIDVDTDVEIYQKVVQRARSVLTFAAGNVYNNNNFLQVEDVDKVAQLVRKIDSTLGAEHSSTAIELWINYKENRKQYKEQLTQAVK